MITERCEATGYLYRNTGSSILLHYTVSLLGGNMSICEDGYEGEWHPSQPQPDSEPAEQ